MLSLLGVANADDVAVVVPAGVTAVVAEVDVVDVVAGSADTNGVLALEGHEQMHRTSCGTHTHTHTHTHTQTHMQSCTSRLVFAALSSVDRLSSWFQTDTEIAFQKKKKKTEKKNHTCWLTASADPPVSMATIVAEEGADTAVNQGLGLNSHARSNKKKDSAQPPFARFESPFDVCDKRNMI